ncbi:MAG: L,D-transpeptidase [Myxococcota bacterium]
MPPIALLALFAAKPGVEALTAAKSLPVRVAPDPKAEVRGWTAPGQAFWVVGPASGPGCAPGWVALEAGGYLCLDGTASTKDDPVVQPPLIRFDPPEPVEYEKYIETGQYDYDHKVEIVPQIYGRRWKQFHGRLWASLEAYERGDASIGTMTGKTGEKLGFVGVEKTKRGEVLIRNDGQVAPLDEVYIYPVSRLQGRDLVDAPGPQGALPAVTVNYEVASVREEWRDDAPVVKELPYHTWIWVDETPDPTGRWWGVREGNKVIGWIEDGRDVRHPILPAARPEGVGDDELWLDVELSQQALSLWRGDRMVYFTVVSTGAPGHGTPQGEFRVEGKFATSDMQSRADAAPEDWYKVEDVPWTIQFKGRYALHGAYWHWGFGRTASHGCINLAPLDAARLFSDLEPHIPAGWRTISARPDEGTLIRVRRGPMPPTPAPAPEAEGEGDPKEARR